MHENFGIRPRLPEKGEPGCQNALCARMGPAGTTGLQCYARDVAMMDEIPAPNLPPGIQQRIQSGRIGWTSTLVLATARTGLILLVQVVVAAGFFLRGNPSPWRAQAPWWTVYATVVDIGCLLLLWRRTRREGIRLFDLFGLEHRRLGREVLWGLLYLVVLFSDPCRWLEACEQAPIQNNAAHSRYVGTGPLVRPPTSALGGSLQLVGVLADLVSDRRSYIPGLLCSPPPSSDRQHLGDGDGGRFLVGLATQYVPIGVRLAPHSLSIPLISAVGRSAS